MSRFPISLQQKYWRLIPKHLILENKQSVHTVLMHRRGINFSKRQAKLYNDNRSSKKSKNKLNLKTISPIIGAQYSRLSSSPRHRLHIHKWLYVDLERWYSHFHFDRKTNPVSSPKVHDRNFQGLMKRRISKLIIENLNFLLVSLNLRMLQISARFNRATDKTWNLEDNFVILIISLDWSKIPSTQYRTGIFIVDWRAEIFWSSVAPHFT